MKTGEVISHDAVLERAKAYVVSTDARGARVDMTSMIRDLVGLAKSSGAPREVFFAALAEAWEEIEAVDEWVLSQGYHA